MFRYLLFVFLALVSFQISLEAKRCFFPTCASQTQISYCSPLIKVLIVKDVPGINIGVCGQYSLYDPNGCKDTYISTRFRGKYRYMQAQACGLKWGEEFPDLYQLKIVNDKICSSTFIDDKEYKGNVIVYDVEGTINIVNEIGVEDYIRSILSAHDYCDFEPELLTALAIMVRTNGYYYTQKAQNCYWAIDASKENFPGYVRVSECLDDAIFMTRQMVMSRTGVYEGTATPFAANFKELISNQQMQDYIFSEISLEEANEMAKKGEHAAQILARAFPNMTIMLVR